MSEEPKLGRVYRSESVFQCVRRRDGSHVWRYVSDFDDLPSKTGGNRWLRTTSGPSFDAMNYAPGTRMSLTKTTRVTRAKRKAASK